MARKRKHLYRAYQRRPNSSERFVMLYYDLLDSPAYHDLTPKQKQLYTYCVRETHGAAARENDIPSGRGELFYMNRALREKKHRLYSETDSRGFERDMAALIEHGFVNCIKSHYHSSLKNVYKLSSRWHHWGEPGYTVPDTVLTYHMRKTK